MVQAPSSPGWVYILTNEAMPGMVKIGLTTRTPTQRAAELSSPSGVPLPFVVAWARAVSDCAAVEAVVHRMLDDRRVSGKRESFRVDVLTARQVIEAAAGSKLGRRYKARPATWRRKGQGRRWRRGGDPLPAAMALAGVALLVVLVFMRPPVPQWLPDPVRTAFLAVESWRG